MRLSVALCTYNGEAHLQQQLDSITRQSRLPDEMVVCDDGSTDTTRKLLESFAATASFPVRIQVNARNLGLAANFERAFGLCDGRIICPADQDDRWHPKKLAVMEEVFDRSPEAMVVFSDLEVVDDSGHPLGHRQWQAIGFTPKLRRMVDGGRALEVLLRFNVVTGTAMGFRAALRDLVLPIPRDWIHDEWIALIGAAAGGHGAIVAIDRPLVQYRQHEDQRVGPGKRGLVAQLAHARAHMNEDYFRRMVSRFEAARERLETYQEAMANAKARNQMAAKLAHAQRRLSMRRGGPWRWLQVCRELTAGNYHRFGYGWRSVAQDWWL